MVIGDKLQAEVVQRILSVRASGNGSFLFFGAVSSAHCRSERAGEQEGCEVENEEEPNVTNRAGLSHG